MKILITSGGTREPIDQVRFISNRSSGKTGATLADFFSSVNNDVYYLHSEDAIIPKRVERKICYSSFNDLETCLKQIIREISFDIIIHAAAVSDFSLDKVLIDDNPHLPEEISKISSKSNLKLILKPNFKIISYLKSYANEHKKTPLIVGFKFTNTNNLEERKLATLKVLKNPGVILAIHNDLNDMKLGKRIFNIYDKNSHFKAKSVIELAHKLNDYFAISS